MSQVNSPPNQPDQSDSLTSRKTTGGDFGPPTLLLLGFWAWIIGRTWARTSQAHGVLLSGQPGTGKTSLARAVASEADVPFSSSFEPLIASAAA